MKLLMKLFRIVSLANLILILFLYIFSKTYLLKNFTNIEIDNTNTNTKVVLNYIKGDLSILNSMNLDYARWDDSYNYLNDRNDNYIKSNFADTTSMAKARISFIFITDSLGNTVYKKNILDERKYILTEALARNITSDVSKLLSNKNTKNIMGIVQYDKYPILLSAERITKSDGSGRSPGILIFARYYDQDEIDILNKNTKIKTELLTYDSDLILNNDSAKKDTFVKVTNENFINGYGILNNIFSKPSSVVKVTLPRDIFKNAQETVKFYLLVITAVLVFFSLGILLLIHQLVIKKINTIKSIIESVHNSNDLSTVIMLKGNDEISELGYKFNNMFHRLQKSDETIVTLAYYDTLTGLPNRKKLLENVSDLLEKEKDNFAFFFIDLDNFKSINDNFGHRAGDKVLAEAAERLKNNTRPRDIVSRIGGDEFIVIIRDLKSSLSVTVIAEKLVKILSAAYIYNDNILYIGASVGISLFPEHGTDVDTLIKKADLAMYEAKNNGGNGYAFYNDIMKDNAIDKLEMKINLKNAMEKNEFITYYQPIIDLKSMKVLSAESLIRWKREERIIPPIEFIPIAKKIGEIVEIDNWMLHNACMQCKKWQELGVKDFAISVNISYKQLIQLNFVELVMNILQEQLLEPRYLNLEITEDEAMEDPDLIIKLLTELKSKGIKISMDDFGTGYSSLSYINKLPIDTIKIDRSLVINLKDNFKNRVIIKSIVVMAHSLDIKVVAEGIETESEFFILKELQCDSIQGYLIGKPMTASDFGENFIK